MEELILKYIDTDELGFPKGTVPKLKLNEAVFSEEEGRLNIGMTANFIVPGYVLEVVKDAIRSRIEGVREVRFGFEYKDMIEVVKKEAPSRPREDGTTRIRGLRPSMGRVEIEGIALTMETRKLKSGKSLLTMQVTDHTETILVKKFLTEKQAAKMPGKLRISIPFRKASF